MRSRFSAAHVLIAMSVLFGAVLLVCDAALIWSLRSAAMSQTGRSLQNIANVLAEQTGLLYRSVESVQNSIAEHVYVTAAESKQEFAERIARNETRDVLKHEISGHDFLRSITLVDANGIVLNSFGPAKQQGDAFLDATLLDKVLTSQSHWGPHFSAPIRDRAAGTSTIYVSRAILGSPKKPLGYVVAAVDVEYFQEFFAKISLGPESSMGLFLGDGTLLARHPFVTESAGQWFSGTAVTPRLIAKSDSGVGIGEASPFGGQRRVVAAHRVRNSPLVVTAAVSLSEALSGWRLQALYLTCVGLGMIGVLIGSVMIGLRHIRKGELLDQTVAERDEAERARAAAEVITKERESSERLLAQQKVQLDAAMNNMSQGLLMLDAEARIVISNSRYMDMYGFSQDDVAPGNKLQHLIEIRNRAGLLQMDPDADVRRILAKVCIGEPAVRILKLNDGRVIRVCNNPISDGWWVATHEDITDRHRAERELERTQKFLDTVLENVPAMIVVKDARTLQYLLVNREGENHIGVSRSQMIGKTASDIYRADTARLIIKNDSDLLAAHTDVSYQDEVIETPQNGTRLVNTRRLAFVMMLGLRSTSLR